MLPLENPYPPVMIKGTRQAEDWLIEAKARFGLALQRLQIPRSKRADFKRQAQRKHVFGLKPGIFC